jgi:hypothetical protein
MNAVSRLYARYAIALLLLTLLAGVYLRASFTWPALQGGMHGPFMVHAHSHTGFFGWAAMAVFAAVTARMSISGAAALLHRVLAHAIGIASAAAFAGFALRGYDVATIVLSALHVLLWATFTVAVWGRVRAASGTAALYLRSALLFLVLSGAATLAPMAMMLRGTTNPWAVQLGVKLFLTPFVTGFLVLAGLGLIYEAVARPRFAGAALALIAGGVLPSTLLYVAAAPPAAWLTWAGRAGMALVAAGMLLFVADTLGTRLRPLARLATLAAAATGVVELLAAAGVGATFMHNRAITVSVLHLVLLGLVTPALLLGLRPALRAPRRTLAFAASLLLMLAPLAATGWPWAARSLVTLGVPFPLLFSVAAIGAILAAIALATLAAAPDEPGAGARAPAAPDEQASGRAGPRLAAAGRRSSL